VVLFDLLCIVGVDEVELYVFAVSAAETGLHVVLDGVGHDGLALSDCAGLREGVQLFPLYL
jgi:hypothetical protein